MVDLVGDILVPARVLLMTLEGSLQAGLVHHGWLLVLGKAQLYEGVHAGLSAG